MTVRFTLWVYVTFLISGALFVVDGAINQAPWSLAASVAFTIGVVLAVVYLELVREKEGGGGGT